MLQQTLHCHYITKKSSRLRVIHTETISFLFFMQFEQKEELTGVGFKIVNTSF